MNRIQTKIYKWFLKNPGLIGRDTKYIQSKFLDDLPITFNEQLNSNWESYFNEAKKQARKELYPRNKVSFKENKSIPIKTTKSLDPNNVLFLPDLHTPWLLDGFIDWAKSQQSKFNCGSVIFAGDIIDGAAWNYHEKDPDGYGVKDELYAAKKQLRNIYKAFPNAISLYGNHDLLISRKAKTAGLSQEFIKDLGDVLEAPKSWQFTHKYIKDNVLYQHGSVGDAFKIAVDSRMSTCQGHFHTKTFVQWSVSEKDSIFGMQIGAGFDRDQYAFAYAKPLPKKPIISLGVILDKGRLPIVTLMPL